ncbi:MAG TPA: hypothetical protein VNA21_11805, partial [Steroidobacteraceae bacterium]|nr:hypothetical protein [Steroidobacteraceae bacterium]
RQGTAIFSESFIKDAPAGDSAPDAFVQRTRFWTMIHEMGHAFNLAHSWQKSHPPSWGTPWIPLTNEPEARSFMNYPRRVAGGETAFYSTFRYRFSNPELMFMRHAPRRFVQMANADWFDHHGFQNAMTSPEPRFALVLRVNKAQRVLEFLEPAMIELKLTNISGDPLVVNRQILSEADDLTLIVKRDGQPAKMWRPFAHRCLRSRSTVLAVGESMYQSLFTGVGLDGWLVAEPGWYTVQACLRITDEEDVVSKPLRLRVLPARGYEEETLAQDFFSDAVGRVLAFDGARDPSLQQANDVLREVTERWPRHCVTPHAAVALAMPLRRAGKVVTTNDRGKRITVVPSQLDEAQRLLRATLVENADASAATLGHIDFRGYGQALARTLASAGKVSAAREVATKVTNTLAHRQVKPSVLTEMKAFTESLPHSNSGARNTHLRKGRK